MKSHPYNRKREKEQFTRLTRYCLRSHEIQISKNSKIVVDPSLLLMFSNFSLRRNNIVVWYEHTD